MNFYPFHVGDYTSRTAHLEPMEDLAYRRILDLYYLQEEALPGDVSSIARLIRLRDQADAIELILREFFTFADGHWHHDRCDREIAKMQDKQAKARASAAASVSARLANAQRTLNECSTNAEHSLNDCSPEQRTDVELPIPIPIPIPVNNKTSSSTVVDAIDVRFADFWKAYPRKQGKGAAEKSWRKAHINGEFHVVMAALEAQKQSDQWRRDGGQYIPNPATWINQRRWEDEVQAGEEDAGSDDAYQAMLRRAL